MVIQWRGSGRGRQTICKCVSLVSAPISRPLRQQSSLEYCSSFTSECIQQQLRHKSSLITDSFYTLGAFWHMVVYFFVNTHFSFIQYVHSSPNHVQVINVSLKRKKSPAEFIKFQNIRHLQMWWTERQPHSGLILHCQLLRKLPKQNFYH